MEKMLATGLALCIVVSLVVISISTPTSASDVLRLDEGGSYVLNLETGSKQTYEDFLNSDQFEGTGLEFNIYVSKTGNPILDDYVLELRTNMDNPEWKFGDDIYHSAEVIVWKGKEEHERMIPKVILSGEVPKPMGKGEIYVTLTVGLTEDGKSLETAIQKLEPPMKFFSTPASSPTPTLEPPKGCLLEYSPSSDKEIEKGTEIEVVCKAWNCGGSWCAIEARVFDAKTGETLAANWENRDRGNKSCVAARKTITVNHDLLLGFQASHWDYEHADWIRDETKYVTIKPKLPTITITADSPILMTGGLRCPITTSTTLTASGGMPPYTFEIIEDSSGVGSIVQIGPTTAKLTAGPFGSWGPILVKVVDSEGAFGTLDVGVGLALETPLRVAINPTSTLVYPGENFSIDVLADSSTCKLKTCELNLSYNSTILEVTAITEGNLLGSPTLTEPGSGVYDGLIQYGITRAAGNPPASSSGIFISVDFVVKNGASPGTYPLNLHDVILNDENDNLIYGGDVGLNKTKVIVATRPTPVTPTVAITPIPVTPTPLGFEAVFAIAGLLAVVFLLRRRK